MTDAPANAPPTALHAADGPTFVNACEALLKGALESQVEVGVVASPVASAFAGLARLGASDLVQRLLARHQTELVLGGDGARAVSVALAAVRGGRSAIALVPAAGLVGAVAALEDAARGFRDPAHGLAIVLEDDTSGSPMLCPRALAIAAGLPVLEPNDLSSLRDAVEQALRLSRAGVVPVAIVVHERLLAAGEMIPARPNRVVSSVDELILQRRLRAGMRVADSDDLMRVARRLELNVARSLPSPGEREVVGFVATGPCERALVAVLDELGLSGRVPVLRLGLVSPIDGSVLQRFLDRIQQAVVLEARPGSVSREVLAAADQLRRQGSRVPPIACRELPPAPDGTERILGTDDALQPSVLVRRILHLLHAVRPSLAVAERLELSDPMLESLPVPARGAELGAEAATRLARQLLAEVDQEIRSRPVEEAADAATRTLLVDALPPRGDAGGCVVAEFLGRERFLTEGAETVRQAARDGLHRILIVVDVAASGDGSDADLARLAEAAIPSGLSSRVRVVRIDVNDRAEVRAALAAAIARDGVDVIVLADGPPARLDPTAIERGFVERDRLGYQTQQRLVWSAEVACELRPPPLAALLDDAEEQGATPIQGSFATEDLGMRVDGIQFRARAVSEQVEVLRTKPPILSVPRGSTGIAPPRPIHAEQGLYRAHVAGWRGVWPGAVPGMLVEAGRAMGYRVEVASGDAPCGRGRRGWSQVLFVRMKPDETRARRTASIPYGEADLVLGGDPIETLRALGPDASLRVASASRTAVVANDGPLEDQFDENLVDLCARLDEAVERTALATHSSVADYASICRTTLLSERLVDVALLGIAFQRGLVPVSVEAIESAVRRAESIGFGRSLEAFTFGRRLEASAVVRRPIEEHEPVERLVRRLALELVRERFGGRRRAERFSQSAAGIVAVFSRFPPTEEVDRAVRATVTALHRSIVWGGTRMMQRYEALVAGLLRADPSGGLAIAGAEALADAILVRDLLYVLAMSTSLEQRRRIRERLGVRPSHGDVLERRFLSRVEVLAGTRRFRLDVRTSDWPSEVVRLLRPIAPWSLRGGSRAQEVRTYAISLAERAARGFAEDPERWTTAMRRFAMLAEGGGFRTLSAAEVRAGVEGI